MTEFTPQQLERWAEIIADRADRMPLRIVYMFDKPRLHDGSHCLGLAFEMDGSAPTRMVDRWAIMSVAELADLGAKPELCDAVRKRRGQRLATHLGSCEAS